MTDFVESSASEGKKAVMTFFESILKGHCHGILASLTIPKYVLASVETQK